MRTAAFEHDPRSATAARRFALEALSGVPGEVTQVVELMVSELASNCIRHTDSGFELEVSRTEREITIEVTDQGGGEPRVRSPRPDEPTGRGLLIVDMLSTTWGVRPMADAGKTVWFKLELNDPSKVAAAS